MQKVSKYLNKIICKMFILSSAIDETSGVKELGRKPAGDVTEYLKTEEHGIEMMQRCNCSH